MMPVKVIVYILFLVFLSGILWVIAINAPKGPPTEVMDGMTECHITYTATEKITTCPN